jgi:hypothetical protein
MNKFELQAKFLFWCPVLALIFLFSLAGAATWYFWHEAEQPPMEVAEALAAGEVEFRFGSMEELTVFPVFRRAYLSANGGNGNIDALQSVRTSGVMESGGQAVPFFSIKRRPNQSLTTLKMPDYELSFVVNGDQVWQRVQAPGQAPQHELKAGAEAEALMGMGAFFDPIMQMLLYEEDSFERLLPSVWDGQEVIKFEFRGNEANQLVSVYVDIQTMHPLARVEAFADGRERRVLYSDYRSVRGMQEPFMVETYLDDVLQSRVIVEKSEANVGTVSSLFEYPG